DEKVRRDCSAGVLQCGTINLVGADGQGNSVNLSTTTDANGKYSFSVAPGKYTVSEVQQSGWHQSAPGGTGTYVVTLTSGQTDSGNGRASCKEAARMAVEY